MLYLGNRRTCGRLSWYDAWVTAGNIMYPLTSDTYLHDRYEFTEKNQVIDLNMKRYIRVTTGVLNGTKQHFDDLLFNNLLLKGSYGSADSLTVHPKTMRRLNCIYTFILHTSYIINHHINPQKIYSVHNSLWEHLSLFKPPQAQDGEKWPSILPYHFCYWLEYDKGKDEQECHICCYLEHSKLIRPFYLKISCFVLWCVAIFNVLNIYSSEI